MIRLLAEHINPRLSYIADLLFREVMGSELILTTDPQIASPDEGPVICYTERAVDGAIHIVPAGLLAEKGVGSQLAEPVTTRGVPCLFPVSGSVDWNCDPFSTAFYLVSRYEEYLNFEPDDHGRFPAQESIAHRYDFLNEPVVNQLMGILREQIIQRWPACGLPAPRFRFVPTFDIDIAYAHLEKGWLRAAGGFLKLILTGQLQEARERVLAMEGKIADPYDNFSFLSQVLREQGKKGLYFFLLGDYGPYDKNISHHSEQFRELVRKIDREDEACLHPSYASADDPEKLTGEIGRMREIVGRPVKKSRQHFLRLKFPYTYRELLKNGITDDYSMGYADTTGFRAGIASPFLFYDLGEETVTNLKVHPFMFMDTAMIDQMKLSGPEAVEVCSRLAGKVAECGGMAGGVWHNYALSEKNGYKGWTETFRTIMKEMSKTEER